LQGRTQSRWDIQDVNRLDRFYFSSSENETPLNEQSVFYRINELDEKLLIDEQFRGFGVSGKDAPPPH
jgi:hypothetical protein